MVRMLIKPQYYNTSVENRIFKEPQIRQKYLSLVNLKLKPMETNSIFLSSWDQYMYIGTGACVVIGVLILLYHEFKVFQIKDYKEKYDYVNLHEVRYFWYSIMVFIIAAAFFANTVYTSKIVTDGMRWFYVRLFITISFTVIAYFI